MTRNNADFQDSVLYHGSPHALSIGDVILPYKTMYGHGPVSSEVAYATTNKIIAKNHADKGHTPGSVYTVEPVDADEMRETSKRRGGDRLVSMSALGFRVTGVHND